MSWDGGISDDWKREFLKCLKPIRNHASSAWRAWKKMERPKIQPAMAWLFFQYASTGTAVDERTRGIKEIKTRYERARYALSMRKGRRRARNEVIFEKREQEATLEAGKSNWPFRNPLVKSVKDAEIAYPLIVGRVRVEDRASVFTKAGGVRRESDPALLILLVAQKYAAKHGVSLGIGRLIALACCAGSWQPDPHTLNEFFSNPDMQSAADKILSYLQPFLDSLCNRPR
jgi:hypothetical protein